MLTGSQLQHLPHATRKLLRAECTYFTKLTPTNTTLSSSIIHLKYTKFVADREELSGNTPQRSQM